ncbi:Protein phosphatase 1B [Tetrabaena socialis]|uniref:Protein phosphatase 1B n=1 Tax=Tetrabaena socialis TaxID=47790 RepID=A0A2J7ZW02_9CHLO|nr:Protein phosphatase 1B [Tetrabaena socialis]|eukprot:PNH04449.1 Protein phosphatase 1B [Tetrabaena socialis]
MFTVSKCQCQGSREYQEDTHVSGPVGQKMQTAAVFDGHGGVELAKVCATHFLSYLSASLQRHNNDGVRALRDSLSRIDQHAKAQMPTTTAGTTACAVLVSPTTIYSANVGDSGAILFSLADNGRVYKLTEAHKPEVPSETDRILRGGGFVTPPHHTDGVHRVMGRLSVSRALGDYDMRPWVSDVPEFTQHMIGPHDQFVVLATDGVWDVMSANEVGWSIRNALKSGTHPHDALRQVLQESRLRGSGDNITLLLVDLRDPQKRFYYY